MKSIYPIAILYSGIVTMVCGFYAGILPWVLSGFTIALIGFFAYWGFENE